MENTYLNIGKYVIHLSFTGLLIISKKMNFIFLYIFIIRNIRIRIIIMMYLLKYPLWDNISQTNISLTTINKK